MAVYLRFDKVPSSISFSRYWESRVCRAAGVPASALSVTVPGGQREMQSPLVVGRFFHSLIKKVAEEIEKCDSVNAALNVAFPQVVNEYAGRYPHLKLAYNPIVQRIYDTVRNNIDFGVGQQRQLFVERLISSSDCLLFGSPDWVMVGAGKIQLIDFKLTKNTARLASKRNVAQLAFYSYLVSDAYSMFPTDIRLVGLNDAHVNVDISPVLADRIADEARACQASINRAKRVNMTLEDLANPTTEECALCRFAQLCDRALLGT